MDHVDAACAGNGNCFGEVVVSVQREGVLRDLAIFPAVNVPLVPLIGKIDPAKPVRRDAAVVGATPAILGQRPVFYILAGAPAGQFNPCSVGGIAHPEGIVGPEKRFRCALISDGGRLKKV